MAIRINNSRVSETAWGDVDKGELGRRLAEAYAEGEASAAVLREAYAFVPAEAFGRDGEGKPSFAFSKGWGPHHVLDGDELILNRGGVQGAAGALAGARSEPSLSGPEMASAKRHIRGHYRALKMEAPDSLKEAAEEPGSRRFVEQVPAGVVLEEVVETGRPRRLRAVGITADVVNANGRRYPAAVLAAAVADLSDHLHESAGQGRLLQLLGEAEHPSDKGAGRPSLLETVVKWDGAAFDGLHVILDGRVVETSKGKDILALLEGGVGVGLSIRGYGQSRTVKEAGERIEEITELRLTGCDLVMNPSDPEARVTMFESEDASRGPAEEGDGKMEANELAEMLKANPGVVKGIMAEDIQKMSDDQRKGLEESLRTALGLMPDADLAKELQEAMAAKRELEAQAKQKAVAEAVTGACKDLPYGKTLNEAFAAELRESVQEAGEVAAKAAGLRKRYDAVVSAAKLGKMGYDHIEVLGPVIESEMGIPEFARASLAFTESMVRRGIAQARNLKKSTKVNDVMALRVLDRFDQVYQLPLMREARLQEAELSTDLNLPYSVSRAILAEVWPTLVATSLFDVDTTEQSPTRVYYEDYANESGKHATSTDEHWTTSHDAWVSLTYKMIEPGTVVVQTTGGGGSYVEGTDYVVDYLDGKIMALSTGTPLTNSTAYHATYDYDLVRQAENNEIQQGETNLSYATLDCLANRLATRITNEAIVFSRSQIGWDATARTLASLTSELRRLIDKALMYNALGQVLKVASNSGGTYTAASDPLIDLVSYIGVAKVKVAKRYYQPDWVLLSATNSDALGNWDGFTAAGSRDDASLNANGYVGRVKGLPVFQSTEFSDAYALVANRQVLHYRVYQPMALKGPYPTYGSNHLLVAADQWYAEQYDGAVTPVANKGSYVKIA